MRKTLAVVSAAGALLLGGAGVANATAPATPGSTSETTMLAQDNDNNNHSDKTGLWGLAGLLGLAGLSGLLRRDRNTGVGPAATGARGTNPRV